MASSAGASTATTISCPTCASSSARSRARSAPCSRSPARGRRRWARTATIRPNHNRAESLLRGFEGERLAARELHARAPELELERVEPGGRARRHGDEHVDPPAPGPQVEGGIRRAQDRLAAEHDARLELAGHDVRRALRAQHVDHAVAELLAGAEPLGPDLECLELEPRELPAGAVELDAHLLREVHEAYPRLAEGPLDRGREIRTRQAAPREGERQPA